MDKIKQLGNYKIIDKLGSGGNGIVFKAESNDGKPVAIKVFKQSGRKPNRKEKKKLLRFITEVNTVIEIQKEVQGVIPILSSDLPDKGNLYWYAMPIAIPVEEKLKENRDIKEIVMCILELAKTLEILHQRDIVHRDIKPQNIYFYNGKYCLADFGLVDYPNKSELTSLQEPVGPRATMAPEMRYNARNADGKKADVYSLAKTLWILVMDIKFGFEGKYDEDDSIIGIRSNERYKKTHLVELDALLRQSTEYDPNLRPNIAEFVKQLDIWLEISDNEQKSNYSEWKYLQNKLFPGTVPLHAEWRDIDSIIKVLNYVGGMPGLNHMFIPTKGGQDVDFAEHAAEEGCIYLVAGGHYVLKPRKLELENFGQDDYRWSYFRLELQTLEPVTEFLYEDCRETLIEDYPGHYVVSKLMNYGRYDDGERFPEDYKWVDRFTKGAFVIFSKQSIYNYISGTYDARHNKMGSAEFRNYIKDMKDTYYRLKDFKRFSEIYDKDPFEKNDEIQEEITKKRLEESEKFDKFIEKSWKDWCFKDICDRNNKNESDKLEYAIYFHINGHSFSNRKYLDETGRIQEEDFLPFLIDKKGKYLFPDFDDAIRAVNEVLEYIKGLCNENNIVWDELGIYFSVELFRVKPPTHLFTEDEIRDVLRAGNDFINNRLVINEDGYVKLINSDIPYEEYRYPVIQETYNAGNNYVGQYANLDDINEIYLAMLDGWLHHLRTEQNYSIDYYEKSKSERELLAEIEKFY